VIVGGEQDRDAAARLADGLGKWGNQSLREKFGRSGEDISGPWNAHRDSKYRMTAGPMHLAACSRGFPVVEISCHPLTGESFAIPKLTKNVSARWLKEHSVLQPEKHAGPMQSIVRVARSTLPFLGIFRSVKFFGAARIVLSRKEGCGTTGEAGTQVGD